jgi:hypothetical protein
LHHLLVTLLIIIADIMFITIITTAYFHLYQPFAFITMLHFDCLVSVSHWVVEA